MLGIWYEHAGVHWGRSGEGKGIRWNWDGIRPEEVCWVLTTGRRALGGTGDRKMENRIRRR